jgi:phosphonate metabolism-associated iron-containing alcohol dehydrogenase
MWRYHNPVDIHFGAGALAELPRVLGARTAVLITFPEAADIGLTRRVQALLGSALAGVISDTQPNPDVENLAGLYERFWRDYDHCDVVIGVGGGSTLDTAKALMIGTHSGRLDDLVALLALGSPFTPARVKRLITIPTTAGTGSEVTPFATIWDAAPERQKKYSLQLKETWAEAAIVDPELTLSLPPTVTLHSALDALSHGLEAIWNVNANPVSDVLAVAAAREILATLPALMARPADIELRTRVARAALTAGLAFSNTKTALAHSLSYEMTLKHGLPHGLACSFTLPMVLARAIGCSQARDAVLAQVFDCPLLRATVMLHDFLESLGVSTRFESYGVASGEPERMVRDALGGVRGKNFIGAKSWQARAHAV